MCAKVYCVIVAAGSGRRFGSTLPKQFCDLCGRPVLMTTIERVRRFLPGCEVLLVLNPDYFDDWHRMCADHCFRSPRVFAGGATRWQSVKNAISSIDCGDDDVVMVHDGARPLVMPSTLTELTEAIKRGHQGAIPVTDVTDSLRVTDDGGATSHAVDRSLYRAVQTPQAFDMQLLRQAYELPYCPNMTDDASVMEAAGFTDMALVQGSDATMKITRKQDLAWVELIMSAMDGEA